MAKTHPIYRLHKIKVHPNRWLGWAIAYAVFVAMTMVGYIQVSEINFESQIAENQFFPWHSYLNSHLGFGLRYPADWSIESVNASEVNFIPSLSSDDGVSIQVTTLAAEKTIRKNLKVLSEAPTLLDNHTATKITNDLGWGHSETVITAPYKNKLYVIRGSDVLVQKLQLTFNLE